MNKQLRITYAKAVYDNKEISKVLNVLKEHREAVGKETDEFEKRVSKAFGKKHGIMVNSGSSANLLAFEALNIPQGSEVITPLLTFSTTVSPIIQKGLIPVFADVDEGKYVINVSQIEKLITKKTKAIMVPLLMGNVPNIKEIARIAKKYELYLIDDSCDTFSALYEGKPTGAYSDITTTSFYGSHIITAAASGGMIMVSNSDYNDKIRVLRGWGRQSCLFNESESVSKRFNTKIGKYPYDAKFIFSEIGYNFLPLEISAAFGNAQLDKLPAFRRIRKKNFKDLLNFFKKYENYFVLPCQDAQVDTQWLAFPLTIKKDAPFTRLELVKYLEKNNIQTRPILTGNILKQPGFIKIKHRIVKGGCPVTDAIMENGFVVGCHQGLKDVHLKKIKNSFSAFLKKFS